MKIILSVFFHLNVLNFMQNVGVSEIRIFGAEIFHNHNPLLNRVYALSGSVFDRDLTAFENEKINSNAPNVQLTGSAMQTPV